MLLFDGVVNIQHGKRNRLMQNVYRKAVSADCGKRLCVRYLKKFGQSALCGVSAEKSACPKEKEPRKQRKIVGAVKFFRVKSERKHYVGAIEKFGERQIEYPEKRQPAEFEIICQYKNKGAYHDAQKRTYFFGRLFEQSIA